MSESGRCPNFLINRVSETERIWNVSTAESLVKPFLEVMSRLTIQDLAAYRPFQSVIGTMTFSGKIPIALSLTITQGRVLLISVPTVGLRLTSQTSLLSVGFVGFLVKVFSVEVGKSKKFATRRVV